MSRDVPEADRLGLGDLFARLWEVVAPHAGILTSAPWTAETDEFEHLVEAIEDSTAADVPEVLLAYLAGEPVAFRTSVARDQRARRAFTAMLAIDFCARTIHPRPLAAVGGVFVKPPAEPMMAMQERRWMDGTYGRNAAGTLATAAKGPLMRVPGAGDGEESGDRLDIHFANLTVFRTRVAHYRVDLGAMPPSRFAPRCAAGDVRVGTATVAAHADDLAFKSTRRGGQSFLDVRPTDAAALAEVAAQACGRLLDAGAEIVALPELCVPARAVDETRSRLGRRVGADPALLVMGSGLSAQTCGDTGLAYNESVVLDGAGTVLWRQRKCNHFRMAASSMDACRLARAGDDAHKEDVASGTTLVVKDLAGLGRVAVLICEDLQQAVPGGRLAEELRFDWIVSPVLDTPPGVRRWTHARAVELSRLVGSRIIVSCSSTLDARQAAPLGDEGACALLLDAGAGRRFRLVRLGEVTDPGGHAVVAWEPDGWPRYATIEQPG